MNKNNKMNKFILGVFKILSYIGCLMVIIINMRGDYLSNNNEIVKPIIYIESLFLRSIVIISILTYAGFKLVKEIMIYNKNKYGFIDKYLSIIFLVVGVYSLFIPNEVSRVIEWFLLSILLYISYLVSVKLYKNNKHGRLK